jgi:hypothetical protein
MSNVQMRLVKVLRVTAWWSYRVQVHRAYAEFKECCRLKGIRLWGVSETAKRRLLNLKRWAESIGVGFGEASGFLLDYWSQRSGKKRKGHLPVPVSVLAGRASREALEEYLRREWPQGENRVWAKSLAQEALLFSPERWKKGYRVSEIRAYAEDRKQDRRDRDRALRRLRSNLRAYRGNPFL